MYFVLQILLQILRRKLNLMPKNLIKIKKHEKHEMSYCCGEDCAKIWLSVPLRQGWNLMIPCVNSAHFLIKVVLQLFYTHLRLFVLL